MVGWAPSAELRLRMGGTDRPRPWCDPVPSQRQTPKAAKTNPARRTEERRGQDSDNEARKPTKDTEGFHLSKSTSNTSTYLFCPSVSDIMLLYCSGPAAGRRADLETMLPQCESSNNNGQSELHRWEQMFWWLQVSKLYLFYASAAFRCIMFLGYLFLRPSLLWTRYLRNALCEFLPNCELCRFWGSDVEVQDQFRIGSIVFCKSQKRLKEITLKLTQMSVMESSINRSQYESGLACQN